jgi:hypothetical protein
MMKKRHWCHHRRRQLPRGSNGTSNIPSAAATVAGAAREVEMTPTFVGNGRCSNHAPFASKASLEDSMPQYYRDNPGTRSSSSPSRFARNIV